MARFRIVKVLSPTTLFPFRVEQKVFFAWRLLGGRFSSLYDAQQEITVLARLGRVPFKTKVVEEYDL
jgi:hypothetical protein